MKFAPLSYLHQRGGQTAVARITLIRKMGGAMEGLAMAKGGCGGCSTGVGFEALGLLALALLRRRRA